MMGTIRKKLNEEVFKLLVDADVLLYDFNRKEITVDLQWMVGLSTECVRIVASAQRRLKTAAAGLLSYKLVVMYLNNSYIGRRKHLGSP